MRSVPVAEAPVKAFYAHVYDQAVTLVKTAGQIWVVREASIEPFEIEMAPFTCVLGEVGLSESARIMDRVHGGAAWIATHRAQEVA